MIDIAILGYGTVGSGVFELVGRTGIINAKYVLDVRDFPNMPVQDKIVHDFETILSDDNVKIIVEVIGGIEPALTYTRQALKKGKSVVTSNKALVAAHGSELFMLAKENKANYLFEASVGGGIPIIRAMHTSLAADEIYEITGILNGTTNYVLTKMSGQNMDFEEALKLAQEKGYAERNPADDVEGRDAGRKISILMSLAAKKRVGFEEICIDGIKNITKKDIEYAEKIKCVIKLLAEGKISEKGILARVSPVMLTISHPLAMVNGVYNAVFVQCKAAGELMFYGKGAGKLATASAVAADIIDASLHMGANLGYAWTDEKAEILPVQNEQVRALIRIAYNNNEAVEFAKKLFNTDKTVFLDGASDEFAVITNTEQKLEIDKKVEELKQNKYVMEIRNIIRLEI